LTLRAEFKSFIRRDILWAISLCCT